MREPDQSHFDGSATWGDDFGSAELRAWFADEREAYVDLYASDPNYGYEFSTFNRLLGFDKLPKERVFERVLGLGSGFGDELAPIADRVNHAVVVESSTRYGERQPLGFTIEWRLANESGCLQLDTDECDLAVSLGVLHHIPNVSFVIREIGRVVRSGGYAVVREPIISMGDWRVHRPGLTPRERGIPRRLLKDYFEQAGFSVEHEHLCMFPLTGMVGRRLNINQFDNRVLIRADQAACWITQRNYRYHPQGSFRKLRPTSTFLTLKKN
jgi:SAM-dependent methyltransferase